MLLLNLTCFSKPVRQCSAEENLIESAETSDPQHFLGPLQNRGIRGDPLDVHRLNCLIDEKHEQLDGKVLLNPENYRINCLVESELACRFGCKRVLDASRMPAG